MKKYYFITYVIVEVFKNYFIFYLMQMSGSRQSEFVCIFKRTQNNFKYYRAPYPKENVHIFWVPPYEQLHSALLRMRKGLWRECACTYEQAQAKLCPFNAHHKFYAQT